MSGSVPSSDSRRGWLLVQNNVDPPCIYLLVLEDLAGLGLYYFSCAASSDQAHTASALHVFVFVEDFLFSAVKSGHRLCDLLLFVVCACWSSRAPCACFSSDQAHLAMAQYGKAEYWEDLPDLLPQSHLKSSCIKHPENPQSCNNMEQDAEDGSASSISCCLLHKTLSFRAESCVERTRI